MALANPLYYTEHDLAAWWPARPATGHKYDHGNVLIMGGSPGLTGAPILAALAAASSGAGKVTVATWEACRCELAARIPPYIITTSIEQLMGGGASPQNARPAAVDTSYDFTALPRFDAVVLGPGLGINPVTQNFLNQLCQAAAQMLKIPPWIVDADAFVQWPWPCCGPSIIFTPHLGEFGKVLGVKGEAIRKEVPSYWPQFAKLALATCASPTNEKKANPAVAAPSTLPILVLKSSTTWIGHLDQIKYVWDFPNATLGKAGSGDILTGIMAALLAGRSSQDLTNLAALAVGVHGLMGKLAQTRWGVFSPHAGTLLTVLPDAIKQMEQASAQRK